MSLIGTQVADYKLQGYQGGDFKEFTAEGAKENGRFMFFIQQILRSFVQLN